MVWFNPNQILFQILVSDLGGKTPTQEPGIITVIVIVVIFNFGTKAPGFGGGQLFSISLGKLFTWSKLSMQLNHLRNKTFCRQIRA